MGVSVGVGVGAGAGAAVDVDDVGEKRRIETARLDSALSFSSHHLDL